MKLRGYCLLALQLATQFRLQKGIVLPFTAGRPAKK